MGRNKNKPQREVPDDTDLSEADQALLRSIRSAAKTNTDTGQTHGRGLDNNGGSGTRRTGRLGGKKGR
ncbi:MAG TPA: hypothetical protein VLB73_00765 [Patescibacteria group bacterium]|nr:hypothetical protein [Patescibacteria group bacterium]